MHFLSKKKKKVNLKIALSIAGVHTSDIITVYISAIKALRELDPSMVILQVACQPIRKYLRLDKILFLYDILETQAQILNFHVISFIYHSRACPWKTYPNFVYIQGQSAGSTIKSV